MGRKAGGRGLDGAAMSTDGEWRGNISSLKKYMQRHVRWTSFALLRVFAGAWMGGCEVGELDSRTVLFFAVGYPGRLVCTFNYVSRSIVGRICRSLWRGRWRG